MSYQAPFVDAATSVDPQNRNNTFISYYSYGSVLGLALDLALRKESLTLDDYFKQLWHTYGTTEIPYTIKDLHAALDTYAGKAFADQFFNQYIYKSNMPDYGTLFQHVGIVLGRSDSPYFGAAVEIDKGQGKVWRNTILGTPAYKAGLEKGDIITQINGHGFEENQSFKDVVHAYGIGDSLKIGFKRYGIPRTTSLVLAKSPVYEISIDEGASEPALQQRKKWLILEFEN